MNTHILPTTDVTGRQLCALEPDGFGAALIGAGTALTDWGEQLTARRAARHAALRSARGRDRAARLHDREEAVADALAARHSGLGQ
ncbi:hypothetical protein GCM10009596_17580 [Arthrobacter rhombi]|uniref:hypothetical protein n=1 Tax=Arthrobacter rhombi TaxID=71253 RepID=UPI0031D14203